MIALNAASNLLTEKRHARPERKPAEPPRRPILTLFGKTR